MLEIRQLQNHVSLGLAHLGESGALGRARVYHRRGELQHLLPVDMARQHRCELTRDVTRTNYVGSGRKCEIGGTDSGSLHALMHAEYLAVRILVPPSRILEQLAKTLANITHERKPRKSDSMPPDAQSERAWPIENMYAWMLRESRVLELRSLVIAGHDDHGNSRLGNAQQGLEGAVSQGRLDVRMVEHVAAMNDDIDFLPKGRLERREVIPHEIVAAAP